jgi:hypothetical protein
MKQTLNDELMANHSALSVSHPSSRFASAARRSARRLLELLNHLWQLFSPHSVEEDLHDALLAERRHDALFVQRAHDRLFAYHLQQQRHVFFRVINAQGR